MSPPLSKSEYLQARSCDAKLYYRRMRYPDAEGSNAYLRLLADGGFMVDALARAGYPEGVTAPTTNDPAADAAATLELLSTSNVTVFQAVLLGGSRMARADILVRRGDTIDLIEVKSKGIEADEHTRSLAGGGRGLLQNAKKPGVAAKWREKLEDITYQTIVLERMMPGVKVRPFLMLIDSGKRATVDNAPSLFRILSSGGDGGGSYGATFVGGPEALAGLDLLALLDVSSEVALLRAEVDAEAS